MASNQWEIFGTKLAPTNGGLVSVGFCFAPGSQMPLRLNDFIVNTFQGVIFTPTTLITPSRALATLLMKFQSWFDGTPLTAPLSSDVPPEIPRVILQSEDLQWGAELGLSRVNFRWVQMQPGQVASLETFRQRFFEFVEYLNEIQDLLRIGRLAFIVNRYIITDEAPTMLSQTFCKDDVQGRINPNLQNFEIHIHRSTRLRDRYQVNDWTRFKTGALSFPNATPRPILLVEQDINTPGGTINQPVFGLDDVKEFTNAAMTEAMARLGSILGGQ